MKRLILAALLTLLFIPSEAPAQYFQYVYRNTPYGRAYAYRQQYGNFVVGTQGFQPYFSGLPYWQNVYAGFPYSNFNAPYYPFLGYSTYQFPVYQQSPQVIVQQPIIIQQGQQPGQNNNAFPPQNFGGNNIPAGNGFGGNAFAGNGFGGNGFGGMNIPLMPAKFGEGLGIPADVRGGDKPGPKVELPKVGPAPKVAELPQPQPPALPAPKLEMPKVGEKLVGAELARKAVESGRIAFAAGEFGRAVELFRSAVNQNAHDPVNYYLLAQAQFAIGKYREAVASISAGMTLKGDWSATKFEPRNLYGKQGQLFDEHLNQLRSTLIDHKDDVTLSFLLGHQLWFDGKKEEAKLYLTRAKAGPRGASPAELFVIPAAK